MVSHVNAPSASISATTSSARSAYPAGDSDGVCVYNAGSVPIFIKSGDSSVAAATSDNFVPAGQFRVLARNPRDTHLAAITASSTATVYFNNEAPWRL